MTEDLRFTFVSDKTAEFPNNENNSFKVRLPRPLTLPDGTWSTSLWSLSVPDGGVESKFTLIDDMFCAFGGHYAQMWQMTDGKYSSLAGTPWSYHVLQSRDVFAINPKSGVELWQHVHQMMLDQQMGRLQLRMGQVIHRPTWRVQQPEAWYPTFRWEGEDWIKEADRSVTYSPTTIRTQFLLPLNVCEVFGFFKYNSTTRTWSLGPNLVPTYPVYSYEATDVSSTLAQAFPLKGLTQTTLMTYDVDTSAPQVDWFRTLTYDPVRLRIPCVILSTALEWRFINLNQSYARMSNQLDTMMVYTNVVQSTPVGNERFPLLRSLQVDRRGQGRVTVEPVHREWIPLNGQTLDTLEFQLATAHGPLTDLSPEQTIVTVGLKKNQ